MQVLAQLGQSTCVEVLGHDRQKRIANEGQIGQQIGVARARAIFSHQGIASPVIADFNPGPVSTDQIQPLLGPILLGQRAG